MHDSVFLKKDSFENESRFWVAPSNVMQPQIGCSKMAAVEGGASHKMATVASVMQ